MPTFTAPGDQIVPSTQVPGYDTPQQRRLFRFYAPGWRARNVYILTDDTVTEDFPPALYGSDGSLLVNGDARIARGFIGGGTYQVNAAEAALLTGAGYTVT